MASTLFLAVPVSALFLLLARPALSLISWLAVASYSITALATAITGLLNLDKAHNILQICLRSQLGASILFLVYRHNSSALWFLPLKRFRIVIALLASLLLCATVIGTVSVFFRVIPALVAPLVWLFFTLFTLPLLVQVPTKNIQNPVSVVIPPPLPSPTSSSISYPEVKHAASSSCSSSPYKHHRYTSDPEAASPSFHSPPTAIKQRAFLICTRGRSIILTLLVSQLLFLLDASLLLLLNVTNNHHTLLAILQSATLVFFLHGNIIAFYLHGFPISAPPVSNRISISVSVARRQDQCDSPRTSLPNPHYPQSGPEVGNTDMFQSDSADTTDNLVTVRGIASLPGRWLPRLGLDSSTVSRFAKIRLFQDKSSSVHEGATELNNLGLQNHHITNHARFTSASSSFSSPRLQVTPEPLQRAYKVEDEKYFAADIDIGVEDKGIELPVLLHTSSTHNPLPSPPDTPKAHTSPSIGAPLSRIRKAPTSCWMNHTTLESKGEQEVRIGIVLPELKPHFVRGDGFSSDTGIHHTGGGPGGGGYDGIRGEVVDVAVSEPGCCYYSSSMSDTETGVSYPGYVAEDKMEEKEQKVAVHTDGDIGRDWSSLGRRRSPKILFSPLSSPTLKSPTLSFMSITRTTPKSPTFSFITPSSSTTAGAGDSRKKLFKSRSTMSLSLSFRSLPKLGGMEEGNSTGGGGRWKRAEKIKGRLVKTRPLTSLSLSSHGHARSNSGSGSVVACGYPPTPRDDGDNFEAHQRGRKGRGLGIGLGFGHRKTVSSTTTTSIAKDQWAWHYPFTSSASSSSAYPLKNNKSTPKLEYIESGGFLSDVNVHLRRKEEDGEREKYRNEVMDTADFVDLTDPFASPTPGFALPKWVGANASSSGCQGSASDVGHGHHSTVGNCYDGAGVGKGKGKGRELPPPVTARPSEEEVVGGGGGVDGGLKTRSSAQWGKLPVIPPLSIITPTNTNEHHQAPEDITVTMTPVASYIEKEQPMKRKETRRNTGEGRKKKKRPDSPMPTRRMSLSLSLSRSKRLEKKEREERKRVLERPGSPVPDLPLQQQQYSSISMASEDRGRMSGVDDHVRESEGEQIISSQFGRAMQRKGGRRNESPVPIPFRRGVSSSINRRDKMGGFVEGEGVGQWEGLEEELLLAQRLLRQLDGQQDA